MKPNRLIFALDPQIAANRLAAGLGNKEENIAAGGQTVAPTYEAWKESGATAAGGYEGFVKSFKPTAIESAAAAVETPKETPPDTTYSAFKTTAEQRSEATAKLQKEAQTAMAEGRYTPEFQAYALQRSQQIAEPTAAEIQSLREKEKQDALIARQKRTEDIKTKEGEAGRRIERQIGAVKQALPGQEGVQTSVIPGQMEATKIAGAKALDQAIGADPELARIDSIISQTEQQIATLSGLQRKQGYENVAGVLSGQADALKKLREKYAETAKETAKTADTRLGEMLTADTLSAIATNPELADQLVGSFKGTTYTTAQVREMAYLQKKVNEYMQKKVLTPAEQLDFDTKKANLAKIQAENLTAGQTEAQKSLANYAQLKTALDAGEITQAYFDKQTLGVTPTDSKFGFQEIGGSLYATDPKTGKATLAATDMNGNPIAPALGQIGNGTITYNYGSRSLNANDNPLLQNGQYGTPGIDIDGNTGDAIQSFVAGQVVQVANAGGYGNQVIIADSSGNQHMYSHLRDLPNLQVGQSINAGALIGYMGNTGSVFDIDGKRPSPGDTETGSHLDYRIKGKELVNGSQWINPNEYLAQTQALRKYTPAQKALLSTVDPTKIDGTTLTMLKGAGLTTNDLGQFLSTEKKQLSSDKKSMIQDVLDGIDQLKTSTGKSAAVGAGIQKYLPGFLKPGEGQFVPGTDAANFEARFNSFRDNLALPNLEKMKGAMSDKDIIFLRNSATSLNLAMPESEFDAELTRLENKYKEILSGGSTVDLNLQQITNSNKINQVYEQIENLINEGILEEEIKATLIQQGVNPSQFFRN